MEKGDFGIVFPNVIHHYQVFGSGRNRAVYLFAEPTFFSSYMEELQNYCPKVPIIKKDKISPDIEYVVNQLVKQEEYNGHSRFIMQFDISEGEYKGFYQKQYSMEKQTNQNAKYKGVHRQNMEDQGLPFFKGLMTSVERSNPGYHFPWGTQGNENTLKGKKFGAVMGREEFITSDGQKRMATKVVQIRSVDGLKDAKIPEDKLLDNNSVQEPQMKPASDPALAADGFMNIPDGIDEELPFM